jgi:very-short-patch-repair endonuclease
MTAEREVERRAAANFGVIATDEAAALGMNARTIRRRQETGQWVTIFQGVCRLAAAPDTWESRVAAAQAWLGKEALASHRTAAALYGLDGVDQCVVEFSAPSSKRHPSVKVHRLRGEPPRARTIKGIRVTSVERTLFDLCAVLAPVRCGRAMDDALRKRLTTIQRLRVLADDSKNRSGSVVFRRLVDIRDDRDGVVASQLETRLLRILKRLPGYDFVPQLRVDYGHRTYYLDFGFPKHMLGVEGHSIRWHLGEDRHKSDVKRDRHLSLLGWMVLYFCWDEVWFEPAMVEAEIRAALDTSVRPPATYGR